jgi:LPXTG-motif cell wall-anchored protein
MLRRLVSLLGALLFVFLAVPAAAQSGNGLVRVIHASPDAPAVDVFVDGTAVLQGVEFPAISNYLPVPAGAHTFKVAPAGAGVDAAVITAEATIESGNAYTIAAINQLANIEGKIFNDDLAAPASGKAHVRVLHLSPDAPAVDVKTQDGSTTLFSNLSYPNASGYLPVDAGTYDLKVTPTGADDAVISLDNTTLKAGTIYDVVAVGLAGDGSIRAVLAAYTPSGMLPGTGASDMPTVLLAGLALVALAGGLVMRRRMA